MKIRTLISIATISAFAFVLASCEDPDDPNVNNNNQGHQIDTADNFGYEPLVSEPFEKQLVDGGFETYWYWQETGEGKCIEYKSSMLYSLNSLYALKDILGCAAPLTTQIDKDAHGGKYALKLTTGKLTDDQGSVLLIPGAIAPLNDNFIEEFLFDEDGISIMKPYTHRPTAIKGYFKYQPVAGDSASVTIILYNSAKEQIGIARWMQTNTVTEWTPFYQMVDYSMNVNDESPAYISLVYSASAGYNFADLLNCIGQEGSTLWLDDMELEF